MNFEERYTIAKMNEYLLNELLSYILMIENLYTFRIYNFLYKEILRKRFTFHKLFLSLKMIM